MFIGDFYTIVLMCCPIREEKTDEIVVSSKTTIIIREEFTLNSITKVLITTITVRTLWDTIDGVISPSNTDITTTCKVETLENLEV
jgi:hypothetical protein